MTVPPRIKAVLSGGGTSDADADADDTGTTVGITSTAAPIGTPVRMAVRQRFLTRRAIELEADNLWFLPPDPDTPTARRTRCLLAAPVSAPPGPASAKQYHSHRRVNLQGRDSKFPGVSNGKLRSISSGGGKTRRCRAWRATSRVAGAMT